jgi:hypothetical protein
VLYWNLFASSQPVFAGDHMKIQSGALEITLD